MKSNLKRRYRKMPASGAYNWDTALPEELWGYILPRLVPGSELREVLGLRLVSRRFRSRVMSPGVFRQIDLSILDRCPYKWQTEHSPAMWVIQLAAQSGNPDAIFREGMRMMYCSYQTQMNQGMRLLRQAAGEGHYPAAYIYGLYRLCYGADAETEGLAVMSRFDFEDEDAPNFITRSRDYLRVNFFSMDRVRTVGWTMQSWLASLKEGPTGHDHCLATQWDFADPIDWDPRFHFAFCRRCLCYVEANVLRRILDAMV